MAINLSDNVKTSAPKLLDNRSSNDGIIPYTSVGDALSNIPPTYRARGLFVFIDNGVDGLKLYWFKDGIGNSDLVEVGLGGSTGLEPSDYDLDEFNNASADPFVRVSEIPDLTTPNLQEVIDASGNPLFAELPGGVMISDEDSSLSFSARIGTEIDIRTQEEGAIEGTLIESWMRFIKGNIELHLKSNDGTEGQTLIQGADGGLEWGDLPTPGDFNPSDHDLDEFQNESADPFVRVSEVSASTPTAPIEDSIEDALANIDIKDGDNFIVSDMGLYKKTSEDVKGYKLIYRFIGDLGANDLIFYKQ